MPAGRSPCASPRCAWPSPRRLRRPARRGRGPPAAACQCFTPWGGGGHNRRMLLRHDDRGVLAIGQPSHAWISGQLARAWGNDRFPAPEPYEEVCLAAEQHDLGFASWDLEPTRNPETGLPHSFLDMPLAAHLGLWSAAPRRLLAQSRYAAALVSMHGWRLYKRLNLEDRPDHDADAVRDYLDSQRRFQEELK